MLMISVEKVGEEIRFVPQGHAATELARRLGTDYVSLEDLIDASRVMDVEILILGDNKIDAARAFQAANMVPVTLH